MNSRQVQFLLRHTVLKGFALGVLALGACAPRGVSSDLSTSVNALCGHSEDFIDAAARMTLNFNVSALEPGGAAETASALPEYDWPVRARVELEPPAGTISAVTGGPVELSNKQGLMNLHLYTSNTGSPNPEGQHSDCRATSCNTGPCTKVLGDIQTTPEGGVNVQGIPVISWVNASPSSDGFYSGAAQVEIDLTRYVLDTLAQAGSLQACPEVSAGEEYGTVSAAVAYRFRRPSNDAEPTLQANILTEPVRLLDTGSGVCRDVQLTFATNAQSQTQAFFDEVTLAFAQAALSAQANDLRDMAANMREQQNIITVAADSGPYSTSNPAGYAVVALREPVDAQGAGFLDLPGVPGFGATVQDFFSDNPGAQDTMNGILQQFFPAAPPLTFENSPQIVGQTLDSFYRDGAGADGANGQSDMWNQLDVAQQALLQQLAELGIDQAAAAEALAGGAAAEIQVERANGAADSGPPLNGFSCAANYPNVPISSGTGMERCTFWCKPGVTDCSGPIVDNRDRAQKLSKLFVPAPNAAWAEYGQHYRTACIDGQGLVAQVCAPIDETASPWQWTWQHYNTLTTQQSDGLCGQWEIGSTPPEGLACNGVPADPSLDGGQFCGLRYQSYCTP